MTSSNRRGADGEFTTGSVLGSKSGYDEAMSSARRTNLISVDEYLAGELESNIKHEFVAGVVHAMAGASNAHNIISTNILRSLGNQLENSICREFNSDTKVRIRTASGMRFYYPDAQVVCKPNPQSESFQDEPVLIVEVLSESTRRADEEEKREYYLTIPSLCTYIMLEQATPQAIVFKRTETGFERLVFVKPDATIVIRDPELKLSFAEIYRDVEFETGN